MSTARKTTSGTEKPNLRQRARSSRQSAAAFMEASPGTAPQARLCEAGRIGKIIESLWAEHDAFDEQDNIGNDPSILAQMGQTLGIIRELETALSYARATSPAGMLAQIAIAYDGIETAINGSRQSTRQHGREQAERCLHSVAAGLCAMTGVERDRYGAAQFMPLRCDKLAVLAPEVA